MFFNLEGTVSYKSEITLFQNCKVYQSRFASKDTYVPFTLIILCMGLFCSFQPIYAEVHTPGEVQVFAGIEFVWCPPGTFQMGRNPGEQDSAADEDPRHQVTLTEGFWMSKYEITQAQWTAVMGSNPSHFQGNNCGGSCGDTSNRPVEMVSWNDICETNGFLDKLNTANPGMNFRLPSEAEWEYACRAGTTTRFYWGDDSSYTEIGTYTWYHDNSNDQTHDVGIAGGTGHPNTWGLYDITGNVWEWCQDYYHDSYTNAPTDGSAWQLESPNRVLRGGSWTDPASSCRSAHRGMPNPPTYSDVNVGFRLVRQDSLRAGEERIFSGIKFVWCPSGTFQMGRNPGEQDSASDEGPQHQVTLTQGFWMSKYEVTQAQWQAVTGTNPSYFQGSNAGGANTDNRPVEAVSWNDICSTNGFLDKLNTANPGMNFRLPSEAEWEYACRAGTTTRFYWGDDSSYSQIGTYAWYDSNSGMQTHDVGTTGGIGYPNAWGLYDMSGNVWEWVQDWFSLYTEDSLLDPKGPSTGLYRVFRGGCWSYALASSCRSSNRDWDNPDYRLNYIGFRLAKFDNNEMGEGEYEGEGTEEGTNEGENSLQVLKWSESCGGNGHGYAVILDEASSWSASRLLAQALGGDLATITSAEEQSVIMETLAHANAPGHGYWFGLREGSTEGDWAWVSGEPLVYTNWYPGEPNNNLLGGNENSGQFYWTPDDSFTNGKWNDMRDAGWSTREYNLNRGGYIVEFATIPANALLIDPCAGEGEGVAEGEGAIEGEGTTEGSVEGEGTIEGEGSIEGGYEGENEGGGEGEGGCDIDCYIGGTVTNSLTGNPVQGVYVEISAGVEKSLDSTYTNASGRYEFNSLPGSGPYDLSFYLTEYQPKLLTGVLASTLSSDVALVPMGVTRPKTPIARSGPRSVYVEWLPNPEYNVKGYNVWRNETDAGGGGLGDAIKINGNPSDVYDGLITGTEYVDDSVVKGTYYVYMIQAISGGDRPSALSWQSDPAVKGEWLTLFFPEVHVENAGVFLWQREDSTSVVTVPLSSRCAYDVSSLGINIRALLPSALINASTKPDIDVQLSGITSGMVYDYNIFPVDGDPDHLELRIASVDLSGHSLYGAGPLFFVSFVSKPYDGCLPMELVENIPGTQEGVRLYDDSPLPQLIDIELENGFLCSDGACTHGDVNMDGVINSTDVDFINMLWVGLVDDNLCSQQAGDINFDGYVDAADAVLIMRWLAGLDITPPPVEKGEDLRSVSFAVASQDKSDTPPLVEIGRVTGATGQEIEVPVTISNAAPLAGSSMIITFPEGAKGVTFDAAVQDMGFTELGFKMEAKHQSSGDKGMLNLSVSGAESLGSTKSSTLVTLKFRIMDPSPRTIPIRLSGLSMCDQYGFSPRFDAPLAPDGVSGAIIVGGGEGEGEGEGTEEGSIENPHNSDQNGDSQINLSELLRVIQFFNSGGYHCQAGTEDGFAPGLGDQTCSAHDSDYNTQDWLINLSELLRLIQFFNSGGYHPCEGSEDGYCPGLG